MQEKEKKKRGVPWIEGISRTAFGFYPQSLQQKP
jgi:hypothetical protein